MKNIHRIVLISLLCLHSVLSYAQDSVGHYSLVVNNINDIEFERSVYRLEIDLNYHGRGDVEPMLVVHASPFNEKRDSIGHTDSGSSAHSIQNGRTSLEINVPRPTQNFRRQTSQRLYFYIFDNITREILVRHEVAKLIDWPGLVLRREPNRKLYHENRDEFVSVFGNSSLQLNVNIPNASDLYTNITENGLYINRFLYDEVSDNRVVVGVNPGVKPVFFRWVMSQLHKFDVTVQDVAPIPENLGGVAPYIVLGWQRPEYDQGVTIDHMSLDKLFDSTTSDHEITSIINAANRGPGSDSESRLAMMVDTAARQIDYRSDNLAKSSKKLLTDVLTLNPDYTQAYHEMARWEMVYSKSDNNWSKARYWLDQGLAIGDGNSDLHVLQGYVYTNLDNYEKAQVQFEKAKRIGSNNWWLIANEAQLRKREGNIAESVRLYAKLAQHDRPVDKRDRNSRAQTYAYDRLIFTPDSYFDRQSKLDLMLDAAHKYPEPRHCYAHYLAWRKMIWLGDVVDVKQFVDNDRFYSCIYGYKQKPTTLSTILYALWGESPKHEKSDARKLYLKASATRADLSQIYYSLSRNRQLSKTLAKLKERGHDLDAKGLNNSTALAIAIREKDMDAVRSLLSLGANPNTLMDQLGTTPFLLALVQSSPEVVSYLLEIGADMKSKWRNISALELAKQRGDEEIIRLIDFE